MVGYAYDLGPRQSARIIEQAVRQQATIWLETIEQIQPRAFSASFVSCNGDVICAQLNLTDYNTQPPYTGQYYQIIISLGETRYLTVSDLLEVQNRNEGPILVFTRPQHIQVMQRRRFHRHVPGQAFPVYISWNENEKGGKDNYTPALGQIKDISISGMSVQVPASLDNFLFIGDTVFLRFSLNARDQELFTSASVCHKEMRKETSELIIGLQFAANEQNADFQKRIRTALSQQDFSSKDTSKGS